MLVVVASCSYTSLNLMKDMTMKIKEDSVPIIADRTMKTSKTTVCVCEISFQV